MTHSRITTIMIFFRGIHDKRKRNAVFSMFGAMNGTHPWYLLGKYSINRAQQIVRVVRVYLRLTQFTHFDSDRSVESIFIFVAAE